MKKSRFHLGNPQVFNLYLLDTKKTHKSISEKTDKYKIRKTSRTNY